MPISYNDLDTGLYRAGRRLLQSFNKDRGTYDILAASWLETFAFDRMDVQDFVDAFQGGRPNLNFNRVRDIVPTQAQLDAFLTVGTWARQTEDAANINNPPKPIADALSLVIRYVIEGYGAAREFVPAGEGAMANYAAADTLMGTTPNYSKMPTAPITSEDAGEPTAPPDEAALDPDDDPRDWYWSSDDEGSGGPEGAAR